ncbi:hypothetical protein BDV93DRAFT_295014 [Ceratobasidium sp. AG-I]|nr:hypothetical protein BDV93DRAFT_295014 [Ceratobasidium sp. AG-I]
MAILMDSIKHYAQFFYSFVLCSQTLPGLGTDISATDNGSVRPPPRLPVEITERISDFVFEPRLPQLATEGGDFISTKPTWDSVSGFMSASMDLHKMGYIRWIQIVTVKVPSDWAILLPDAHLIRAPAPRSNTRQPNPQADTSTFFTPLRSDDRRT